MLPHKSLSEKGQDTSKKVVGYSKTGGRLSLVAAITGDGKQLPLMFIFHGTPGGNIEMNELTNYPNTAFYTVQKNGWMDGTVWRLYLDQVICPFITGPTILVFDNLKMHVSDKSFSQI